MSREVRMSREARMSRERENDRQTPRVPDLKRACIDPGRSCVCEA